MTPSRTRDVRLSTLIRAEPERAYQALTSARELCLFWLESAETDARSRGRFRMVLPGKGAASRASAVFVDLEPGRKVAWLFRCGGLFSKGVPPLVSVFLDPRGKGTEATVLHAGFPCEGPAAEVWRTCWEDFLARLKLHLEGSRVVKRARYALGPEGEVVESSR